MFNVKTDYVLGLTTFCNEYLNISVSGLAKLDADFVLIIYNDNPNTKLTKKHVRNLGYNGPLYIINTEHNVGVRQARLNIVKFITKKKINAQWGIFLDDDDVLINLNIPNVSDNNWAIVQNMAIVNNGMIDVLRIINNPNYELNIDGKNIELVRPHLGLVGTPVRISLLKQMAVLMENIKEQISDIDESVNCRPPVDEMMWAALNIIARHNDDAACPIFMDTTNYLKIDIDSAAIKYGTSIRPNKCTTAQAERIIERHNKAIVAALDAAPAGQNSEQ
ncbi:MAG: hypothetical protein E7011_04505 [Alphaproteobacteria bacterium]|nr:hypothetical protein [Alphaproteobacteria bacterium]